MTDCFEALRNTFLHKLISGEVRVNVCTRFTGLQEDTIFRVEIEKEIQCPVKYAEYENGWYVELQGESP